LILNDVKRESLIFSSIGNESMTVLFIETSNKNWKRLQSVISPSL